MLHPLGVLGLFDFSAAFPSISRAFIIFAMRASGFPDWIISMTSASWADAKVVSDDGSTAYEMHGGVGQGCPAAAAAFVIGISRLLVALFGIIDTAAGEAVSAFADDIAMVVVKLGLSFIHI